MKILIFTEGTILMHKNAVGHSRDEIVEQVKNKDESVHEYGSYVPIGNATQKIKSWQDQGVEIFYLTSRRKEKEIEEIKDALEKYNFPEGRVLYRKGDQEYKNVAEQLIPDIIIEDDCESIGGVNQMTYTNIQPDFKNRIKLISIKEFGGIDYLPDNLEDLLGLY